MIQTLCGYGLQALHREEAWDWVALVSALCSDFGLIQTAVRGRHRFELPWLRLHVPYDVARRLRLSLMLWAATMGLGYLLR